MTDRRRPAAVARLLLALAAAAAAPPASAAELSLPGRLPQLEAHGFVSQGFLATSSNNYLADSSRGSFEFSELGLNFTLAPADRLRLGVQIFSQDLGPIGNYEAKLDWYYLDYHWQDWLGVRAGRVKLPFGLYNDSSDIDAARTAVLLPQSIYPAQNRNFLLAQTGGELYGYKTLGRAGGLDYRVYAGTIFLDLGAQTSTLTLLDLNVPYVAGGRILWNAPLEGLRMGGSVQFLRLDAHLRPSGSANSVELNVPAILWVASAEYVVREWLFAAEYSRWRVRTESSDPSVIPESQTTSERGYALATYRINSWLQAGGYYSLLFPNVDRRVGPGGRQHDVALTLRFDVNSFWLVKVETHYMHGTAALTPSLNGNQPLSSLKPDWALFTVKTTAYF